MGASFGAVASLSRRLPLTRDFGRLLLQSGSFARSSNGHCATREGSLWEPVIGFVDRFLAAPVAVSRAGVRLPAGSTSR